MRLYYSLLIYLLVMVSATARGNTSYADVLQRLDDVVDQRESFHAQKREQLDRMVVLGKSITAEPDRYLHNTEVYDACFTFDSELAMQVVKENLEIARHRQNQEGVYEWQIKESFLLASTGQFLEAVAALDGISAAELPHELQLAFYSQKQYLYSHMNQYSWNAELKELYYQMELAYTDSIYAITIPSDSDYIWYKAWQDRSHGEGEASIDKLKARVDTLAINCRRDAMLCYVLALLYADTGDHAGYMKYMSLSAMADVRSANLDIASLEELAIVLFEEGDLDRSYKL